MHPREIEIPEPCSEDWDSMTPGERGRFCASCQKTVHDLSSMTEAEAREVLKQEDVCVTFELGSGGLVRFERERVVPASRLTRRLPIAAAAGLSLALAACAPHGEGPSLDGTEHERPSLLEYSPAIPDAEPCDATTPPQTPALDDEPTSVEPPIKDRPRRMGRRVRPPAERKSPKMGKPKPVRFP